MSEKAGGIVVAIRKHVPVDVTTAWGVPFVECSCCVGEVRWHQVRFWLRDHWQGDAKSGQAAIADLWKVGK